MSDYFFYRDVNLMSRQKLESWAFQMTKGNEQTQKNKM